MYLGRDSVDFKFWEYRRVDDKEVEVVVAVEVVIVFSS